MHVACRWPGCPALLPRGQRYCERHAVRADQMRAERHRLYDRHARNTDAKRFYASREWQALRLQVLQEQPICDKCGRRFAREVDHIEPRELRPDLELVRSNLHGLCTSCHSSKTMSETRSKRP